jgi:hypothetical protein
MKHRYKVLRRLGGTGNQRYEPGMIIELDPQKAARHVASGNIIPVRRAARRRHSEIMATQQVEEGKDGNPDSAISE